MASSFFPRVPLSPRLINVSDHSQLSAASGHCGQSDLKTEIRRSIQLTPPTVRVMASGRCTAIAAVVGDYSVACPCPRGVFDAPLITLDVQCKKCTHPLSQHEDVSSAPASDSSQRTSSIQLAAENPPALSLSPLTSLREDTVAALWKQLQQVQVVHIRGTPTSGKSTLARLLDEFMRVTESRIRVYRFSWPSAFPDGFGPGSPYHQLLNWIVRRPLDIPDDWWKMQNTLLIIDEAQMSYEYDSLWNDFIKPLTSGEGGGPMLVLLSSYGSPSETPVRGPPGSAPIHFSAQQRVSIRSLSENNPNVSLYFTRLEFDDVVVRVCKYHSAGGQSFLPSPELLEYVWEFSNGHPGGTRAILDALIHAEQLRPFRKTNSSVSLDAALEFLNNDEDLFTCLTKGGQGFKRSLPKREALQENPAISQFLRKVLASNRSEDKLESNPALNDCYKKGWLQAELSAEGKTIYVFPTMVHKRYAESLLRDIAPPFPLHQFPSVRDLCFAAVRQFSQVSLCSARRGLGAGAVERPIEAQYQDEFYRACYTVLSNNIYLTSEWSGESLGGRIDFQIKSTKWAIECVREGDRLEDHIARFQLGGIYYKWVISGEIQEYAILDFRKSKPRKVRDDDHLYSIVFSDDYTSYETYDAKLELVGDRIALLG